MDSDLAVYTEQDRPNTDASYAERVQAGIAWLITEGPLHDHLLQNLCVHLDELDVNMPESCVLGWSSGFGSEVDRAHAYHARIRAQGFDRSVGYRWAANRGFRLGDDEPHSLADYEALTAEWKAALAPLCEEDHR
jgi:hypothetical protein